MKYRNPVIPGFYPDPSVCRVGEDYYLVNSSFEFFPGVPLWHSRDLVNWEQKGYVLTRKSQDDLTGCRTSGGIYAPTIRYRDGRFYMVTTNVTGGGHFYVWTEDIDGEWSEPIFVEQQGIDPSIFWDDDGRAYFISTFYDEHGQCIGQAEIDLETGKLLTETKPIWRGTGGKCPEGPHMYKINGKYYLMIAEGGTEYGHMETIARSDSVWGPFESCPHNPIVTHRDHTPSFEEYSNPKSTTFQGLGHADLVDDKDGNWFLVFHGFRPSASMLHHTGRETMLAPVTWDENGWPHVNEDKHITAEMDVPTVTLEKEQGDFSFEEDFTVLTALPPRWAYLRNPAEENYEFNNGLVLTAGDDDLDGFGAPTFVGVRQQSLDAEVNAVVDFHPEDEEDEAGISVFHTNEHHYDLIITKRDNKRAAILRRRVCDMMTESEPVFLPDEGDILLRISAERTDFEFYADEAAKFEDVDPEKIPFEPKAVGWGRTQLLSTEMMLGTFTGCFFALFSQGENGCKMTVKKMTVKNSH